MCVTEIKNKQLKYEMELFKCSEKLPSQVLQSFSIGTGRPSVCVC